MTISSIKSSGRKWAISPELLDYLTKEIVYTITDKGDGSQYAEACRILNVNGECIEIYIPEIIRVGHSYEDSVELYANQNLWLVSGTDMKGYCGISFHKNKGMYHIGTPNFAMSEKLIAIMEDLEKNPPEIQDWQRKPILWQEF